MDIVNNGKIKSQMLGVSEWVGLGRDAQISRAACRGVIVDKVEN